MEDGVFIKILVGGFYMKSIVAISEFGYLYFEIWVGCERWFICRWGSYDACCIGSKSSKTFTSR